MNQFYIQLPNKQLVFGMILDTYVAFFNCFSDTKKEFYKLDYNKIDTLFLVNNIAILFKDEMIPLDGKFKKPYEKPSKYFDFDKSTQKYYTTTIINGKKTKTEATEIELLKLVDTTTTGSIIFVASEVSEEKRVNYLREKLKTQIINRLLRSSMQIEPTFPYKTYNKFEEHFYPKLDELIEYDENFDTKTKKKIYEKLFKNNIVPFAEKHGFKRLKTAKRLVKECGNSISQHLIFRSVYGNYQMDMYIFDENLASFDEDIWLCKYYIGTNTSIKTNNEAYFNYSVDRIIRLLDLYIFPFFENNQTHSQMVNTILQDEAYTKYDETYHHRLGVYMDKKEIRDYLFEKSK